MNDHSDPSYTCAQQIVFVLLLAIILGIVYIAVSVLLGTGILTWSNGWFYKT